MTENICSQRNSCWYRKCWIECLHVQDKVLGPNNTLVGELKEVCCAVCDKLADKGYDMCGGRDQ